MEVTHRRWQQMRIAPDMVQRTAGPIYRRMGAP